MLPQHPQIMSPSRNTLQLRTAFPRPFKGHFTLTHFFFCRNRYVPPKFYFQGHIGMKHLIIHKVSLAGTS